MTSLGLSRYALTIGAASALLVGCGGSQPPIGVPGAMPQQRVSKGRSASSFSAGGSPTVLRQVAGVRPARSCPGQYYAECITLAYGSPFEQEWCIPKGVGGLSFGPSCNPVSGTWQWYTSVYNLGRHHSRKWIEVSVHPNPGNPVEVTISESQPIKSSHGKIAYGLVLKACDRASESCTGKSFVGIKTK